MSKILIVARTRMQHDHVCIGGHDLDHNFRAVRLLDRFGGYWRSASPFAVGEVWDMRYQAKDSVPPHVEDVKVEKYRRLQSATDFRDLVLKGARPWIGAPNVLFDATVQSTSSGTAYIPTDGPLPRCSTGYWVPDKDLARDSSRGRMRFTSTGPSAIRGFAWVGVQEPPERIDAQSLVRVSLSRSFASETAPEGYYVQISGVLGDATSMARTVEVPEASSNLPGGRFWRQQVSDVQDLLTRFRVRGQ
jgi:hypothetical protein